MNINENHDILSDEETILSTVSLKYYGNLRCPKVEPVYFKIFDQKISKEEWAKILQKFNKYLEIAYIPLWTWFLIILCSFGLLGWIILIFQKKRTTESARKLGKRIYKLNQQYKSQGLRFEIPLPSQKNVLIKVYLVRST